MFDWLKNLLGFTPAGYLTRPQELVSPIPEGGTDARNLSEAEMKQLANEQAWEDQFTMPDGGGGGGYGTGGGDGTTSFGMPGELVGALRDVNGITWQHQGGDKWVALRETGQTTGDPVSDIMNAVADPLTQALQDWNNRLAEFERNNPFSFDEAQARASSEERLNPYYNATLNEYITGWRRSSQRSVEDMTRTVGELNADASKLSERERFATQEAIRSSEEGYAGSGLFFSGARERETGVNEVKGIWGQEDIATKLGRNVAGQERANLRTQEDLALERARTERLTEAERTTALETDIAKQEKEARVKRGLEQLAYAGPSPGGSFANQLTMQNQLFGMY